MVYLVDFRVPLAGWGFISVFDLVSLSCLEVLDCGGDSAVVVGGGT